MGITTLKFFMFFAISLLIYYSFPKKYRWGVLLITSFLFYLAAGETYLILYMLFGVGTTYIGTRLIDEKLKTKKDKKIILFFTLSSIILELAVLKYLNFVPETFNGLANLFRLNLQMETVSILAPLGISYYTLSLIGYTLDVYWGTSKAEKNILKHALFTCYYPIMVSGPIVRYEQMKKELFEPKKFEIKNVIEGAERILYGLLKKMVIADQLALVVQTIFGYYQTFSGFYLILGVLLYAIQIYADFSGCIDIVLGVSKAYGVVLPENFNSPFFSRNLSEFWRRWHISLGQWGKDYIMYPLLKSEKFQKLGKVCKDKWGKKIGKKIPVILATLILWLVIGFWHGASYQYIFAAGILPWIYLVISELGEEQIKKIRNRLPVRYDTFSYRLFESLRTIDFMCIIWLFVSGTDLSSSCKIIIQIFQSSNLDLRLSLPQIPNFAVFLSCFLVFLVDYLKYKGRNVLELLNKQNLVFKYIVVFGMAYLILTYGAYGPGYNPVDFIYGGF